MTMHFTPDIGDEIMDVYSTIYSSYSSMLDHLCSSPLMAIMVIGNSGDNCILYFVIPVRSETVFDFNILLDVSVVRNVATSD